GSGWILIRSSHHASLPGLGTRVGPSDAANMAKLKGPADGTYALATEAGAHHYRLVGLEMETNAAAEIKLAVLAIDGGAVTRTLQTFEQVPRFIFVDRCYIHGKDGEDHDLFGIVLNGAHSAVVDSYVANFKSTSNDETKAISSYASPGP